VTCKKTKKKNVIIFLVYLLFKKQRKNLSCKILLGKQNKNTNSMKQKFKKSIKAYEERKINQ